MYRMISFLKGAAVGAGIMYFFDPVVGNRRRAGENPLDPIQMTQRVLRHASGIAGDHGELRRPGDPQDLVQFRADGGDDLLIAPLVLFRLHRTPHEGSQNRLSRRGAIGELPTKE